MTSGTRWEGQDILKLTKENWLEVLHNREIMDENVLRMIDYVYSLPEHTSTASDIALAFGVDYRAVTAWNRRAAKKIYEYFFHRPPLNQFGTGYRYWNVIFDCNPEKPQDDNGHYYWRLRPNLIKAWEDFKATNAAFHLR